MSVNTRRTAGAQSRTRGSCAWGAAAALVSLALLLVDAIEDLGSDVAGGGGYARRR